MSLTQYRAFITLCRTKSFSEAALAMHCTQSALSKMIAELESLWGVRLFSRGKKLTALTADGEALRPYIQKVIDAERDLKSAAGSITGLTTGTVRIGAFASVATRWLPQGIETFSKIYPNIRYELLMGDYFEIEEWVRTGAVDFGFLTYAPEKLKAVFAARDELILAVPKASRFYAMESVPVRELEGESFILLEKGGAGEISAYLKREGVRPNVFAATFEDHALIELVRKGLGVGMLPRLILEGEHEGIGLKRMSPATYRDIYLVARGDATMTLAAKSFLSVCAAALSDRLDESFTVQLENLLYN